MAPPIRFGWPHRAFAALVTALALGAAGAASAQDGAETAPDRPADLALLLGVVREPNLELEHRASAAQRLLERDWGAADRGLLDTLRNAETDNTRRAVARALAQMDAQPPEAFRPVLIRLLGEVEPKAVPDLARALGRYEGGEHNERLIALARGEVQDAPRQRRRGAVLALAGHRTREAAGILVRLLEPPTPSPIREAAFSAIGRLTGIASFGKDAQRWRQWWDRHRNLSEQAWARALMQNFAGRARSLEQRNARLQQELVEAQRRIYRDTEEERRPAVLRTMISDKNTATRRLGMTLAEMRLLDNQPIGGTVRAALRRRLADDVAELRREAALLLRDLGDSKAADRVAERLKQGEETHPAALRACLLLLARMPRAKAVPAAVEMLERPLLRGEAASAVAAAAEEGMLSPSAAARVRGKLRHALSAEGPPSSEVVALLGVVAEPEDWKQIAEWLESEDDAVRAAAARAWAESDKPLRPLMARAGDPVIRPIAVKAADDRGHSRQTLLALVELSSNRETLRTKWWEALVTLARRVDPEGALAAAERLRAQEADAKSRVRFLGAALEGAATQPSGGGSSAEAVLDLRLERAAALLDGGEYTAALSVYERLRAAGELRPARRRRLRMGMLRAHLATGEEQQALRHGRQLVAEGDSDTVQAVIERFIRAARRNAGRDGDGLLEAMRQPLKAHGRQEALGRLEQALARRKDAEGESDGASATRPREVGTEQEEPNNSG